jgi:hypothetical protein
MLVVFRGTIPEDAGALGPKQAIRWGAHAGGDFDKSDRDFSSQE